MQDAKWYEDIAHVIIGIIPIIGWAREWKQWPPASDSYPPEYIQIELYFHHSRVEDAYRDFLGYTIGDLIRTTILGALILKCLL